MVENLLGWHTPISGIELAERALKQLDTFNGHVVRERVMHVTRRDDGNFEITSEFKNEPLVARTVVVATGLAWKRLDIPGADYVIHGDQIDLLRASAYTGKKVGVIGGGNSAAQCLLHMSRFNCDTHLIVRGDDLGKSMSRYLVDRIKQSGSTVLYNSTCVEVQRSDLCLQATMDCGSAPRVQLDFDVLVAFIGGAPATSWLSGLIRRDERGFIHTDASLSAGPGIFAIGDVRVGGLPRIAHAMGEGARVVASIHSYLA
jgi:thioredoxin reductase (NADPH)